RHCTRFRTLCAREPALTCFFARLRLGSGGVLGLGRWSSGERPEPRWWPRRRWLRGRCRRWRARPVTRWCRGVRRVARRRGSGGVFGGFGDLVAVGCAGQCGAVWSQDGDVAAVLVAGEGE